MALENGPFEISMPTRSRNIRPPRHSSSMNTAIATLPVDPPRRILLPALVDGCMSATLDAISAFMTFGCGKPWGIAAGLLGAGAGRGGGAGPGGRGRAGH